MKKVLSLVLSLIIVLSMCAGMSFTAEAAALKAPSKVKVLYVENSNALITWKKVKNAKGYIVYSSKNKKKGYKKVIKLNNKNFNRATVELKGKNTYIKVVAFKGKKKKASKPLKVKNPYNAVTPTDLSLYHLQDESTKKSYVWLYYNITGYVTVEVYRSESANGSFAKISETGDYRFSDSNVSPEKTYYYKIRCKSSKSGKIKYSGFTEVRSINLKETPVGARGDAFDVIGKDASASLADDKTTYKVSLAERETKYACTAIYGDGLVKNRKGVLYFREDFEPDTTFMLKYKVSKVKTGDNGKRVLVLKQLYFAKQVDDGSDHEEGDYPPFIAIKINHNFSLVKENGKASDYVLYLDNKPYYGYMEYKNYSVKPGTTVDVNGKAVKPEDLNDALKSLGDVKVTVVDGCAAKITSVK